MYHCTAAVGKQFSHLLRHMSIVIAAITFACTALRQPFVVTVPDPNFRPVLRVDAIFDYRTAAATVAAIFQRDLGFPAFPVSFRFYPGRGAFEKALLDSGYDPALAKSTARTMSAVGGYRAVLVNEVPLDSMSWAGRVALFAHEMGHSLQYELGGGRRGASDQWLREGFADWLSIRVLERLDGASIADVRRVRRREMSGGRSRTPRLADLATFPQWVEAGEESGAKVYALAFLAVDYLLEKHGPEAVLDYFRRFASSSDRAANFRAAFGEDLDSFEAALASRLSR
jgi:hypothetical protein